MELSTFGQETNGQLYSLGIDDHLDTQALNLRQRAHDALSDAEVALHDPTMENGQGERNLTLAEYNTRAGQIKKLSEYCAHRGLLDIDLDEAA